MRAVVRMVSVLFFLSSKAVLFGQNTRSETAWSGGKDSALLHPAADTSHFGHIEIFADPKISLLMAKHMRICDSLGTIPGYRLQIFFGNGPGSKSEALRIKSAFLRSYKDIPAYISWVDPNWVIRVGNCRTKLEALRIKEAIGKDYPGTFIVRDEIELPDSK